jgi:hypothetical protein
MPDLASTYLTDVRLRLEKLRATAEGAVAQCSDASFTASPDAETNSIALTIKHIAGNLNSRFSEFIVSDGEKPDRHRDDEFILMPRDTREALMQRWSDAWDLMLRAVVALTPGDLERTLTIRGEQHTVVAALNRNLVHLAYHIGQIVQLAKHYAGPGWRTLTIARGASETYNAAPSTDAAKPTRGDAR